MDALHHNDQFLIFVGLKKEVLEPCVQWMSVYWKVLRETSSSEMENVKELLYDEREIYNFKHRPELQTHDISQQLYVSISIGTKIRV